MHRIVILLALILVLPVSVSTAQSSASFKIEESAFVAAGHPDDATILTSTDYRITFDTLAGPFLPTSMSSAGFISEATWFYTYRPPLEISGLVFVDKTTLEWIGSPAAGSYNLYRDTVTNLAGASYGNCIQQGIPSSTTMDADAVPGGETFFYLVTVENRLGEEGGKGSQSDGMERIGSSCP